MLRKAQASLRRHLRGLHGLSVGIVVAVAYLAAARFGLLLVAQPEDVAVFWPASGIAAGVLIAGGRRMRAPVIASVLIATFVANILDNRDILSGLTFALCNAGEVLLAAWLVERWHGPAFRLDRVRNVWGFLLASTVAAAAAAVPAALGMRLFHTTAGLVETWRIWAVSDAVGIFALAPLIIEARAVLREPPPAREQLEAGVALGVLAAMVTFIFTLPPETWIAIEPVVVMFPVLFWMAARYHPACASAGLAVLALGIVITTTFGIGTFGDPNIPASERVLAAQVAIAVTVVCVLAISAVFSERRKAGDELERTNRRLRLALEGAELGVWDLDAVTGRFHGDARYREIHGWIPGVSTLTQVIRLSLHPEDAPRLHAAVARAFETGIFKAEYRVAPSAGEAGAYGGRWVAAEGALVRGADGRPLRLLGVARDITQSKKAAEALRESEARLRDALRAGQVMAFEWNPVTNRTRHSDNAAEILGLDPANGGEVSGRDFLNRVHPDDRDRFKKHVASISPVRSSYAVSFRYIRADGREVWLEETAKAEFDEKGRFVRLKGLTRDVTARSAAQQALVESERLLRLLVEGVADYAIVMLDPKGHVMNWNVGAERMTGYSAEEITGQPFSRFFPSEEREAGAAAAALNVAARAGRFEAEGWRMRKDGSRFWASVVIDAISDRDGRLIGFATVTRDISERKRMEEHQKLLIAELDHRVKNALASVAIVARRTRETSRSVDEFVAALEGRIQSMANAHALLSRSRWQGVRLSDLVRGELAPYATSSNTVTRGPEVMLTARATQTISMVLHELTTNAAKYGALSTAAGQVSVIWTISSCGRLQLEWSERGGPPPPPSPRQGYGTSVIRNLIPHQLDGAVDLSFSGEGVRCRLEIPLSPASCAAAAA
jgi:PAS domain S-box-containing protein